MFLLLGITRLGLRAPALLAALVCLLAPAMAAEAPLAQPIDAAGWRALTLQDLDGMHTMLRELTPIPYDAEYPAYARWMEEGHVAARARAAQVNDAAGYLYTLKAYANGFRDPHIAVVSGMPRQLARWPGFIAAKRGEAVVVVQRDQTDAAAPALGTRIEACDGQPLAALAEARVLPFILTAGLPEHWVIPELFQDRGNPFAPPVASCTMRVNGKVSEVALHWREVPSPRNYALDYTTYTTGLPTQWGLTEPSHGVFWIGVPSFLNDGENAPQLRALVNAVAERGAEMRKARAIVIDTRGNFGGNADWIEPLAEAIFTREVLETANAALPGRNTAVERRASSQFAAEYRDSAKFMDGNISANPWQRGWMRSAARELERAAGGKPPIWRTGARFPSPSGGLTAQRPRNAEPRFPARVYFLSNGSCNSACLIFADKVLAVPGVRLIGSATSGDTPYLEARSEKLPSGLAALQVPTMVMRGRGRGPLEAYAADIAYEGAWDDASVRAWTMGLIEANNQAKKSPAPN